MRVLNSILLFAASLAITACTSSGMRSMDYKKNLSDPVAKRTLLAQCISDFNRQSQNKRANMAVVMRISEKDAPSVFCKRLIDGIASGRITTSEVETTNSQRVSPKVLKVILGQ
jgi:hypothetical protein